MRKVVAGLFISLDGVVEAPNKWHFPYWSDEMGAVINARVASSDAILLGRITYQEFAGYWPTAGDDNPMAAYLNNSPKYVVSTTLKEADWNNTTVIGSDIAATIKALKEQPGADIAMIGSGTLIQSLLQMDLLDELDLLVHPIVVGTGKRLFPEGYPTTGLELIHSKTFSTGVLSLTYRRAAAA